MNTPYCTLDRRRFGLRIIGMLFTLSTSCVLPLQLHASLPRTYNWPFALMSTAVLISASCLSLRPSAATTDGLCKLSLQLVFVTLSWSTTIVLSCLELTEENCFGPACIFYSCDMASPVQLHLKQDRPYAGQAGSLEDFFV